MISVREAESIIMSHLVEPRVTYLNIEEAVGNVLAEDVQAEDDFPPFDRVTMDGIAISSAGFHKNTVFEIVGTQGAGQPPLSITSETHAVEVMTGALLPSGTDSVIRYEDLVMEDSRAKVQLENVRPFQNVHRKASDLAGGQMLIRRGTRLTSAEIALLASVGKATVPVFEVGPVAIVSTGDELTGITEKPLPWQVRQSNNYALQAALAADQIRSVRYHLSDDAQQLKSRLVEILSKHEIIILSGGVSRGKFDYIPPVLEALGVKKLFHQVSQKPGKPFWFGANSQHTVFALPGNPVSTFLCFTRYVRPWLLKIQKREVTAQSAVLAADFRTKPDLTFFLQVKVQNHNGMMEATPVEGGGSGDFVNLRDVDAFMELPSGKGTFFKGESFRILPIRP